jgi:hypothetical protein
MRSLSGTIRDYHGPEFYTLLHHYIIFYDFKEAKHLIEDFGYKIQPLQADVDAAIATVKQNRPSMPDRGEADR